MRRPAPPRPCTPATAAVQTRGLPARGPAEPRRRAARRLAALLVIQAALIVHTRNTLVDAAVQGAHHAALAGSTPQDGAQRARQLVDERFGRGLEAEATAVQEDDGTIRVQVDATLPLVGLIGPAGALSVEGRAVDEEAW